MNKIKALGIPKIKALGLNNLRGVENPPQKSLSIRYVSCEQKGISLLLVFEIETKGLKKTMAHINVFKGDLEPNIFGESIISYAEINPNGKKRIEIKVPLGFNINNYFEKDTYYRAIINVDELSATSERFKINPPELGKTCFCNRDFTVDEMQRIVKELRGNTFYGGKTIEYYHQDKLFYLEPLLNANEKNNIQILTWVLNQMFEKFKINTCIRKINFLAQMYPETQYFTDLSENNPSSSLGEYCGRGFIQLTHKGKEDARTKNADSYLGYKKFSKLDVISEPDLLCKSLNIAADSAGWFWRYGKLLSNGSIKDLNTLADIDDANEISRLVNGGENARKERLEANKQLKKIFRYESCVNKK
ncbi:MAG: hypothetical protein LBE36_06885 [Flavobacteriaceae bacterium]|jgi:predicted chitinase|nr:hypothetical protein [Flavobacteriaceae bacterium]